MGIAEQKARSARPRRPRVESRASRRAMNRTRGGGAVAGQTRRRRVRGRQRDRRLRRRMHRGRPQRDRQHERLASSRRYSAVGGSRHVNLCLHRARRYGVPDGWASRHRRPHRHGIQPHPRREPMPGSQRTVAERGTTPADAAGGADFVFLCVGDDSDVRAVTTGEGWCTRVDGRGGVFSSITRRRRLSSLVRYTPPQLRSASVLSMPRSLAGRQGPRTACWTVMCGGEQARLRSCGAGDRRLQPGVQPARRTWEWGN